MSTNTLTYYDERKTDAKTLTPIQVSYFPLDLASFQSISDFVKDFSACYSKLDILVNNAGVWSPPFDSTEDNVETTMGINYLGHFYLTKLLGIIFINSKVVPFCFFNENLSVFLFSEPTGDGILKY